MSYTVTLIPGDGIGPEVTEAARNCVDALNLDIVWEIAYAGGPAFIKTGSYLPEETLQSIRRNKVALKGPVITPVGSGFRSVNVAIRQKLELFACLRPVRTFSGMASNVHPPVDIVVVRENSEDLYAGIEFNYGEAKTGKIIENISAAAGVEIRYDSAISIKPISLFASKRIADFAFDFAAREKRKKVYCVHKANILKATDGLFLTAFYEQAKAYPKITAGDIIVDNLCMQLVLRPGNFDVLVLPNLYGDIISDLCAGLVGGLGVAPGANIGNDIAVFEPVHGSAPKYTGKNKVNPAATILSAAMMVKYLGEKEKASLLESAVREVIKEGRFVTYDLKSNRNDPSAVGTKEMAEAITRKVKKLE
ncbi:MAG: isocitrate/isopropylmalate dehydrogenase family protein [Candidatus Omnitrophota bacterium]